MSKQNKTLLLGIALGIAAFMLYQHLGGTMGGGRHHGGRQRNRNR